MPESTMEPRAEASAVAWNWRGRADVGTAALAREAAANRRKGLIGGAIGLAVAALFYFVLHRTLAAEVIAAIAILIALIALASPLGLYKGLTRVLDRFAYFVGAAFTWLLMPLLFYLVFLPAGLFLRARGKLGITRGNHPDADRRLPTYWIATDERERARTPESYRKQF
ncbi:MAG TPA: hypothetical protein VLB76_15390 [Thermoanaerobaculia bacterium]|nr:hypothetical protein [Thermoanaerobaculia bacterium]